MALTYYLKVRVNEATDSVLTHMAQRRGIAKAELVRVVLTEYAERHGYPSMLLKPPAPKAEEQN